MALLGRMGSRMVAPGRMRGHQLPTSKPLKKLRENLMMGRMGRVGRMIRRGYMKTTLA